jgi:ABC-type antimicrobial peptide transport system permease subunit
MFKNYIKIAFRNLLKNKVYSFINIFGLAIGMAVTIMIGLWINDELSHNNYFANKATVAQMFQSQTFNGKTGTGPAMPRPLEFELRENYKDHFKHIVMSSWSNPLYLRVGDKSISRSGNFMQEKGPELLDLKIIQGVQDGLKEINSIMLSESVAKDLFNTENPIGKTVTINDQEDLVVTAVYEDIPENNSFDDLKYVANWEMLLKMQEWMQNAKDSWGNNSFQLFLQISDNSTMESVTAVIKDAKKKVVDEDEAKFNPQLMLLPMKDWHLRSNFENGVQTGGRIENVWLFGIIGMFVLLLACINFINLSTARSEKRATEVGIRKSIGSSRKQLITQFLSESFLVVVFAFILAIGSVLLFLNGFNTLASKSIVFPWGNGQFWLVSLLFIAFTAFVSGSYPALYLSSFNPVTVLKGTFKAGRYSALPRKILVVTQFTFSVALIIGTMVVMSQIQYSKDRPSGYSKDGLVQIPTFSPEFEGKSDIMRNQFIASGAAIEMATTSSPTTAVWSNRGGYTWEGKPEGFQEDLAYTAVSYEFTKALNIELVEGRGFSREFASDSNAVILNQTAVKYMGIKNPIGKIIRDSDPDPEDAEPPLKIIGVIKDMITQSPYSPVKQAMYVFNKENSTSYYNLRLNPEKSISNSLVLIEKVFKRNFPNLPFEYQFIDQEYAKKFRSEERVASLAKVFTILAIFISCLGLFGLASFVAEQRTKEIGIRKILGASVSHLWMQLSKDFLTLVLISLVIASPLAYYFMSEWLQKFTYRIDIPFSIFLMAGFGALLITFVTVSIQAIRAVTANPANSLRTE